MCTQVKIRAFDAVLPPELIKQTETNEKTMTAAATFVVNLIDETIRHVQSRLPHGLDAFPGDRLCQARLIILPELLEKPEVCKELQTLSERIKVEKGIASLEISPDVNYLMNCRLLKITRTVKSIEPSGILLSKTDHKQLATLSKELTGKAFEKITQNACTRVSKETLERLQEYGRRMRVTELHQRMLDHVVVFSPPNFPPRSFGCQFFTVKLALLRLLEQKNPLAIKTIVPEGASQFIFFKAQGNDFMFQEAPQLEKRSYVAIFQAVVPSEKALVAKVQEIGFVELILRYSAQETPFEHTSSLDSVKELEARTLIEEYRKKAAESGCDEKLMRIHHLYSSTIQEEVK